MHFAERAAFLGCLVLLCRGTCAGFVPPGSGGRAGTSFRGRATNTRGSSRPSEARPSMAVLEKGSPWPELGASGFTLSTYNVLLPNSSDGWWIYKYYQRHVPREQRQWEQRSKLVQSNLIDSGGGESDIVCLQELSADSFESDFAFMKKRGYESVLHTKFRFRTATFFKKDKFELKDEKHGDRTLTTLLALKGSAHSIFVVNCHLTGGPNPEKRMRQVHDATEYIRKSINKMQPAKPAGGKKVVGTESDAADFIPPAVLLCGDFNEQGETAVRKLLVEGVVPAGFEADGVAITAKAKKQELGTFKDVHSDMYEAAARARPATLICPSLDEHFLEAPSGGAGGAEQAAPTAALLAALRKAFDALTGGKDVMDRADMEEWLKTINGQLGRGSEFRNSEAVLQRRREAGEAEVITFEDFSGMYVSELREGKFWGVHHDLQQALDCPVEGAGVGPSFSAIYDYIYAGPGLRVQCVREELSADDLSRALKGDDPLPNAWQPSDHVMQSAAFHFMP
jgi:mRNA deadenylase 3'-5' endonuclease subunit Ccr4